MTPEQIQQLIGAAKLYPASVQKVGEETFAFAKESAQHYLIIVFDPKLPPFQRDHFSGEIQDMDVSTAVKWCLPSYNNAQKLRALFPWTAAQTIGMKKSFGAGDRLGLAAAAHIRAARGCDETGIALILAQQSIREMTRTQRTPADVMDAATWGAFRENYRQPWGADADHLKTPDDIRNMAEAGFTFFTIDPSAHVDDAVEQYSQEELAAKFAELEHDEAILARYAEQNFEVPGDDGVPLFIEFPREVLMRAAVKYARAIDHTVALTAVLDEVKGRGNYELEMSVDETETPTSVAEHYFIARELKDRDVPLDSLAIRFIGEFQKGIDYIGDLEQFEARLKEHVLIARLFGPYKISVHSGSDKYSAYPILGKICGEMIHVKTAGTWYLEALRTAARCDIPLFREICDFAAQRFMTDRATYHVAENLDELPDYQAMSDEKLETLFDNNTFRQMLHVTFGSVLTDKKDDGAWRFRSRVFSMLNKYEDEHLKIIEEYSRKHLAALGWC